MIKHLISLFLKDSLRNKFSNIYSKNLFHGIESQSGEGSGLTQTKIIRMEIPSILKELHIKTLLDAPCGDFFWMQQINRHWFRTIIIIYS